ncbi:hypothetical protein C8R45DRAFT_913419 [Mycena sanguinolenta]|nr:hypothetical protein C8R45DRAFT_913419 [Mycena sanguinolenta]
MSPRLASRSNYGSHFPQKCDGARPICSQCRTRPPRSKEPCQYPPPEGQNVPQGTPSQMLETIYDLRRRIDELEYLNVPDPTRIYLNQPYDSRSQSHSPDLPGKLVHLRTRVDVFLGRFTNSGYFFLRAAQFRHSALLPLPFGHRDRPSPALLSAVYLWASVLSHVTPDPYTADAFLTCALQNIPQDLIGIAEHPQLVVDTIQAEVLLSLYYLHTAHHVQGRYHAFAASSIALGANLHSIRSAQYHSAYPTFTLQTALPLPQNPVEESIRIDAFWAVVLINNIWAGVEGSPPSVSYPINIDSPWPSSSHVMSLPNYPISSTGTTNTGPLLWRTSSKQPSSSNASSHSRAAQSVSTLARLSCPFVTLFKGPPDPASLASLDRRLHTFQAALPPLPGMQTLVLTHALVDLAIVRLHAPYLRTSDTARAKCLSAAARVVVGASTVNILDGARNTDAMLGPIYAGVARVYMDEITALRQSGRRSPRVQAQGRELEMRLGTLMSTMASLAPYSPLIGARHLPILEQRSQIHARTLFLRYEICVCDDVSAGTVTPEGTHLVWEDYKNWNSVLDRSRSVVFCARLIYDARNCVSLVVGYDSTRSNEVSRLSSSSQCQIPAFI